MSPKIVDKDKKKREILLAAMKVFAGKGVKNTRMVDIAQEAGIGKGTVYDYFRSRDEILVEAFYLIMGDLNVKMESLLSETGNPETKVRSIIHAAYNSLSQFPDDFMEIFVDFWSEGIRQRDSHGNLVINLADIYADFRRQLSQVLNEGIEKGDFRQINTTAVSSTLMAILDGLLLQLIVDRKAFDQTTIIDDALGVILNGIKNTQTTGEI